MTYRIGVDIGGTFTDFTALGRNGEVVVWKEDSTPDEPSRAIMAGLNALAARLGRSMADLLAETELFVHGTTIATNMLIERKGPVVGMLCTQGFRDTLYFRNGYKPDRFNLHLERPQELVDRWLRIGIPGRWSAEGDEICPLDEEAVRAAARQFERAGATAVAIAFLWSMLYPDHERRAADILREELPGVHVVCSHVVLPEISEWQRTSATAISAYVVPSVDTYLRKLDRTLRTEGFGGVPLIMQSNGGCARIDDILRIPVNLLASGPAAAPAAALQVTRKLGGNLVTVDMGGTSFDVCLIEDGRPSMSSDIEVGGHPIGVQAVDVHSIGAGGGSIAWLDPGDALRVGPESAGSLPGPACYGFGGTRPTVTDANVVLGYLDPDRFLGGRRRLDSNRSSEAIESQIARPLGLSTVAAAAGIIRVVNDNMIAAIRDVSIRRGIDPRPYALVCGGGAGGLHAAAVARGLEMRHVFVPLEGSVFCSFGMTITDIRHDHARALHAVSHSVDLADLNRMLASLEGQALAELREEGIDAANIRLERSVDARYLGQVHHMAIPVPAENPLKTDDIVTLTNTFHAYHEARYKHSRPRFPVEFLHWRVAAIGATREEEGAEPAEGKGRHDVSPDPAGARLAFLATGMESIPIYPIEGFSLGANIVGPALIIAPTTTILIGRDDVLARHDHAGLLITLAASGPSCAAAPSADLTGR